MRLHRFFVSPQHNRNGAVELTHDFWLHDPTIIHQWRKVLRFQTGQEVVLFDGKKLERLYKIIELKDDEAHLQLVTDMVRKTPKKEVYLLWSLLKKDKNDWVLQKCTELGVSHFVPLIADRSEKTGFNVERAEKIVIEASEQCGRGDIPTIREPMHVSTALDELKTKATLYICEQDSQTQETKGEILDATGVLIGPEGGWSDQEKELFKAKDIQHIDLHDFTLRAETAAVAAVTGVLQK